MLLLLANVANVLGRWLDEFSHDEKRPTARRLGFLGKSVFDHPAMSPIQRVEDVRDDADDSTGGLDHIPSKGKGTRVTTILAAIQDAAQAWGPRFAAN